VGTLVGLYYPWGLIVQVICVLHFIRRRPDMFWIWVILFVPFGALIYLVMEVIPDAGLLRVSFDRFPRRKRIRYLEAAILDNPSVGNLEDLADLYLDDGNFKQALHYYDKAIAARADIPEVFYRRALASIGLNDIVGAIPDLEYVVSREPRHDHHRAAGLLAHAYAVAGDAEAAEDLFAQVTSVSTQSETYLHYATFLASQQRHAEARAWAGKILSKKPTMPRYLRRRERPWFSKANALIKRLPAG
jgi:hypothetical protein